MTEIGHGPPPLGQPTVQVIPLTMNSATNPNPNHTIAGKGKSTAQIPQHKALLTMDSATVLMTPHTIAGKGKSTSRVPQTVR